MTSLHPVLRAILLLHVASASTGSMMFFCSSSWSHRATRLSADTAVPRTSLPLSRTSITSLRCQLQSPGALQSGMGKRWVGQGSSSKDSDCFCFACNTFALASVVASAMSSGAERNDSASLALRRLELASTNQTNEKESKAEHPEADANATAAQDRELDGVSSAMIRALKGYKALISPILPPSCRFFPTCSEYSMQAIREFGPTKGLALTAWRLLRCNPVHVGKNGRGYDPPRWPPPPYGYHWP